MTRDEKESAALKPEQHEEENVGALLRRTRLAKNQDLRDIASYLCIRYQFLEALEEGRYKELPGEAYANGFIRSYAAYLGLDSADIITRYKQEFFRQSQNESSLYATMPKETENIVPAPGVLIFSVILLLAAFGLWQAFSEKKEEIAPVNVEPVDSIVIVDQSYPLAPEERGAEEVSGAVVPPVPPVKPEYKEEQKEDSSEASASSSAAEEKPSVEQKTEPEPRVYGQKNYKPRLVLVAKEDVWIEITRDETILFSRLLNRGDKYMVSSNKPEELFLKTGNAGGLEIYCDGKLTQALGPRGSLRSNVALIPDDFAAKVVEDIE